MPNHPPHLHIVCLSGLRWEETLFQRPQQLMSRFARAGRRVLYVANIPAREAARSFARGRWRDFAGRREGNLVYLNVPFFPLSKRSRTLKGATYFLTAIVAAIASRAMGLRDVALWLYYPVYIKWIGLFRFRRLVYDCMDLFTGFRVAGEGEAIRADETRLLERADIVFTGGKSLHKARGGVNPHSYCFPSGVDFEHFAKAALPNTPTPHDIESIPRPILGYFGAVDERVDFALLDRVCAARPDWSIVLIGPRVAGQSIPIERCNFHYLGPRAYANLPGYLKAFDVCLMPFVRSELTLHISPTKTPEYLSGGKPVVSTPIPDVIEDYGDVVQIASTADEFVAKTKEALKNAAEENSVAKWRDKAETVSWDRIAREMLRLSEEPTASSE